MKLKGSYALIYTVNSPTNQKVFPVADMDHAVFLAEAISRSDNLNKFVSYNSFDLCKYDRTTGEVGESWEHPDYDEFVDYWLSLNKTDLLSLIKMSPDEMRGRIHQICYSKIGCDWCPYDTDVSSWCHKGTVGDIPEDQLDEILMKMETSV